MRDEVNEIIKENETRHLKEQQLFNPITGEGSLGDRQRVEISDFPIPVQWLPKPMMNNSLVKEIAAAHSISTFLKNNDIEENAVNTATVIQEFIRVRCLHDFAFWASTFIYIKNKNGGVDILFKLSRPQRKLIAEFEKMRLADKPIRVILLKARQWGGSTATQVYMAWIQIIHKTGLNSLIVSHVQKASANIREMFLKLIAAYPDYMLDPNRKFSAKLKSVDQSGNDQRLLARNCRLTIGTMENPDAVRSGDYSLVHCSEVGLWKTTEGKKPEDVVRAACSGVLYQPLTMIVYESTANGTHNFFHKEWQDAKEKESQFQPVFVAWHEIEGYSLAFSSEKERYEFARRLVKLKGRESVESVRQEPGRYLWMLWQRGVTLEALNWYVNERRRFTSHGDMASEYPSDDVEAFVHSGAEVFNRYQVDELRRTCRAPMFVGDIYSSDNDRSVKDVKFIEQEDAELHVWTKPETMADERVVNRYLVVVDIGGRSNKADWSVIAVFDRIGMIDGLPPAIVAQWRGHIDMDLLAWKAAQVATYYDNALLVIESNTLETHDRERQVDGDQSGYILSQVREQYTNLYARRQSQEEIIQHAPRRYGFHTNAATKPVIISGLVRAVRERLYVERDEGCLDEFLQYEKKPNGSFGAVPGKHDDMLMTRAIGLHVCFQEMELPRIVKNEPMVVRPRRVVSAATI